MHLCLQPQMCMQLSRHPVLIVLKGRLGHGPASCQVLLHAALALERSSI